MASTDIMSEETNIAVGSNLEGALLIAYNTIPYGLISQEVEGTTSYILSELTQIMKYYKIYKEGNTFNVEGTNGDYEPAQLHYKLAQSLINKEVRFLFAESPTITINAKGDIGKVTEEAKQNLTILQDLVDTILDANKFEDALIKAAKDCFIGKRVAGLINFNEDDGVTITFIPATQFMYETKLGNNNILTKFVAFITVKQAASNTDKRIFKKKYILENDSVYLEEILYDGAGTIIEEVTPYQELLLDKIPAVIFLNDGLTGDEDGESEIEQLADYESWYSKLSNADIDAGRKGMNPIRYVVDMENNSTKNLSLGPGAFWDLGSEQNNEFNKTTVGMLEPAMNYSTALSSTLDRVKTTGYEAVDMPNVSLETMVGSITSGKALKAIYWPLIVRCKEKMKMWGPQLRALIDIIIQGAYIYPNTIEQYTSNNLIPVDYEIIVEQNTPLPEDELEEKAQDILEVEANVISRKTYMKKWHNLTDDEVNAELEQIALERQVIEEASFHGMPIGPSEATGELSTLGSGNIPSNQLELSHGLQDSILSGNGYSGNMQLANDVAPDRVLNGQQINALLGLIASVRTGEVTPEQASNIIQVGFGMSKQDADKILAGANYNQRVAEQTEITEDINV